MNEKLLIKKSKYLSKHLRHAPERIGLVLEPGGWVLVEDLLRGCANNGMSITRAELDEIVLKNDKQRYSFDETGLKIRANQGHSVEVDLELQPTSPPPILYHGTADYNVKPILKEGLKRRRRHHVHLSVDTDTAYRVGTRHGRPVIFTVDARAMHEAGYDFYCSDNGVWLVDEVPPKFLSLDDSLDD